MAAGWIAVIAFWGVAPLTLTVDDSYYYFQIARHVAAGHGLTFDGIQETSGFHPLWLLVLVPFGRGFESSPELTVRLVLIVQVAMTAIGVRLLAGPRDTRHLVGIAGALALAFNFTKIFVNGLESALEFLLLAAALTLAERRKVRGLALVCGLLCLARVSALPAATVLLVVVLRRQRAPRRAWFHALLQLMAPLGLYSLFLYSRTGHAFPVSGAIKYGHTFWYWHGAGVAGTVAILVISVFGFLVRAEWQSRQWPVWLLPLVAWIGVQLCFDVLIRAVLIPEIWYLVPHATLLLLAIGELVRRRREWQHRIWVLGVVAGALSWALRVRPETYSFYVEAKRVGEWLASNTPTDARIAGWDCGIAAFQSRRTFSNLDGLASSWKFKTDYRDQGRIREFLDSAGVTYVAQYVPPDTTLSRFHGVDLSDWEIVYDEPYEFRGILVWLEGPTRHRFVILRRR